MFQKQNWGHFDSQMVALILTCYLLSSSECFSKQSQSYQVSISSKWPEDSGNWANSCHISQVNPDHSGQTWGLLMSIWVSSSCHKTYDINIITEQIYLQNYTLFGFCYVTLSNVFTSDCFSHLQLDNFTQNRNFSEHKSKWLSTRSHVHGTSKIISLHSSIIYSNFYAFIF